MFASRSGTRQLSTSSPPSSSADLAELVGSSQNFPHICCPCFQCLHQWLWWKPSITEEMDEENNAFQPRYDAYQALLGNLMTIGTLNLGFILTGTMLGIGLTGTENYDWLDLSRFLSYSLLAVLFSGTTSILAFISSIRGVQAHANYGARRGVKVLRRTVILMSLGEFCLYASLFCLLISVQSFLFMQYLGPDICPKIDKTTSFREYSFCSLVSEDAWETTSELCQTAKNESASLHLVCQYFRAYKENQPDEALYRFLWDHPKQTVIDAIGGVHEGIENEDQRDWDQSGKRMQIIEEVLKGQCKLDLMQQNMNRRCSSTTDDTKHDLCTQSYLAFHKAEECVGAKTDDVTKCHKVCAWSGGWHPRSSLNLIITLFICPSKWAICFVAFIRTVKNLQHIVAICQTEDTDCGLRLCHYMGLQEVELAEYATEDEMGIEEPLRSQ